jgi:HK97 family phage prohead protease
MEKETRSLLNTKVELRKKEDGTPEAFIGEAIVFNQRSENLGWFVEIIDSRALAETDMSDVVALFNHDSNYILGRSTAGTLKLKETKSGLSYEVPYDADDEDHRKVMRKIQKGEVVGSSFAFTVGYRGDDWDEDENGVLVRTITKIKRLYDVSPVVTPAYPQTSAAKRCMEEFKKEHPDKEAFLAEARANYRHRILQLNNYNTL